MQDRRCFVSDTDIKKNHTGITEKVIQATLCTGMSQSSLITSLVRITGMEAVTASVVSHVISVQCATVTSTAVV